MVAAAGLGVIALAVLVAEGVPKPMDASADDELLAQVLRGRTLVITHACGGCHGGFENPASEDWLAGLSGDTLAFRGFRAWPRNLTPDVETGLGAFSERQIFNALRYGLRPRSTPDVEITSAVPGEGNHPTEPDYLSPAMPWPVWRYMSDEELRDVAAYLKHGLRPVSRFVQESQAPPDLWASEVSVERIDTHELPPFPTEQEELRDPERRDEILLGRRLVASRCGICHGGGHPGREGWMAGGGVDASEAHPVCAFCDRFRILGFWTWPRNLTPHNTTGMGRFSERQIFNALRYGLRPGETADVEVTSTVPGEGNHPPHPKYLAPPMPWPEWRHMSDEELRAIAAYLKHGLKPVARRVEDSEGPPDFWVDNYTGGLLGTYPAPEFPTARERWPAAVGAADLPLAVFGHDAMHPAELVFSPGEIDDFKLTPTAAGELRLGFLRTGGVPDEWTWVRVDAESTSRRSSMVMTVLEARVAPERWEALRASYAERARLSEDSPVVESFLVQADDDLDTWRIVTLWKDRESLAAMRASGETPTGVLIFRDADTEPRLSIFTVFANPRATAGPSP